MEPFWSYSCDGQTNSLIAEDLQLVGPLTQVIKLEHKIIISDIYFILTQINKSRNSKAP